MQLFVHIAVCAYAYNHYYLTTPVTNMQFITETADKISEKMTSALLAMSLSYYYVMGEHVGKEKRMDEILSTLLSWSDDKTYMNTTRMTKGVSILYYLT